MGYFVLIFAVLLTLSGCKSITKDLAGITNSGGQQSNRNTEVVNENNPTREQVVFVQSALTTVGYHLGSIDGILGPRTKRAIQDYQTWQRLPVTGKINASLITHIKKNPAYVQKKLNNTLNTNAVDGKISTPPKNKTGDHVLTKTKDGMKVVVYVKRGNWCFKVVRPDIISSKREYWWDENRVKAVVNELNKTLRKACPKIEYLVYSGFSSDERYGTGVVTVWSNHENSWGYKANYASHKDVAGARGKNIPELSTITRGISSPRRVSIKRSIDGYFSASVYKAARTSSNLSAKDVLRGLSPDAVKMAKRIRSGSNASWFVKDLALLAQAIMVVDSKNFGAKDPQDLSSLIASGRFVPNEKDIVLSAYQISESEWSKVFGSVASNNVKSPLALAKKVQRLNSPEFQDDPIERQLGRFPLEERKFYLQENAEDIAKFESIRKQFAGQVAPTRVGVISSEGSIQVGQNVRRSRADSQITEAKSARDVFSVLRPAEPAIALRLIHRGHFDGAIEYFRRINEKYLQDSGTQLLFGLFPGFNETVESRLNSYRGETLIAQYVLARVQAVGLCDQPSTTFGVTVTNRKEWIDGFGITVGESSEVVGRYTLEVPRRFATAIEKADATGTSPVLGPQLMDLVSRSGGCDSIHLKKLEDNMVAFMAYRPAS